jgi:hypothetical protein
MTYFLTLIYPFDIVYAMTTNTADRKTEALTTTIEARQLLKRQLDELTEQLAKVDEAIIAEFREQGLTSLTTVLGKINLIQSNTVIWNDSVLEATLTTAQWNRITERKLNKHLLEAEITIGRIDPSLVEGAKSIKQSKPYLR